MLLKTDAEGPHWTGRQMAEASSCRTKTVESVRQKFVTERFDASLNRKRRDTRPRAQLLNGQQEARIIAIHLLKNRLAKGGHVRIPSSAPLRFGDESYA